MIPSGMLGRMVSGCSDQREGVASNCKLVLRQAGQQDDLPEGVHGN